MFTKELILAAATVVTASAATAAALSPSDFEVTSLPGLDNSTDLGFKHYAGHMPIGDAAGTELFFWFVESQRDPKNDPVVLWMNGGPGSSSIAFGFWTEHGPFRLAADSAQPGGFKPVRYDYSWNRIANVVYVEAPSGVGLSFSKDTSKYQNVTDEESSYDNFLFLQAFFKVFNSFAKNDFYITAESYGGHYGPTLAAQVLKQPNDFPMKGLLIGNPGINSDWYFNVNEYAFVTFCWSHGLIPAPAYFDAVEKCGWNDFFSDCARNFTNPDPACLAATTKAVGYIPSPLDPYDVIAPTCHVSAAASNDAAEADAHAAAADALVAARHPFLRRLRERHGRGPGGPNPLSYNPCISHWTPKYMNRADVLEALHVDPKRAQQWPWPGDAPGWSYNQGVAGEKNDIALLFPTFFAQAPQWKILVVSGTADSAVPFMGTERWLNCLGRPVKADSRKWSTYDGDVAGMVKDWDHVSLATVKGCGHTIPTYCPAKGYQFFENWLTGVWK